ncbi:hypothetical protein CC78DRAFT_580782 [Lojkania enalia]|uniref:Uncharacterized protein n=1 Tax=Lojkania enalia TaxID=147567 RepID=A0A9P4KCN0_9PLEO|nr:hypothetical protein CC78DRAFT_580782 [Didymosphaeria enalia]
MGGWQAQRQKGVEGEVDVSVGCEENVQCGQALGILEPWMVLAQSKSQKEAMGYVNDTPSAIPPRCWPKASSQNPHELRTRRALLIGRRADQLAIARYGLRHSGSEVTSATTLRRTLPQHSHSSIQHIAFIELVSVVVVLIVVLVVGSEDSHVVPRP